MLNIITIEYGYDPARHVIEEAELWRNLVLHLKSEFLQMPKAMKKYADFTLIAGDKYVNGAV